MTDPGGEEGRRKRWADCDDNEEEEGRRERLEAEKEEERAGEREEEVKREKEIGREETTDEKPLGLEDVESGPKTTGAEKQSGHVESEQEARE